MIIVDTGFWFGLLDRRDQYHSACYSFLSICEDPLITTFPVLTESMHLLMNRGYPQQGLSLWKTLQQLHQLGKFSTFSLTDEHLPRLQQLLEQYQSLPTDLADASLVLLAEHLGPR